MRAARAGLVTVGLTVAMFLQAPHAFGQDGGGSELVRLLSGGKAGAHGGNDPHSRLLPEKQVEVALQHKAEGRLAEAFATLDKAISRYGENAELLAVRGSFYLEAQDVTAALRDFESALSIDPDNAELLTNRAQAYRHFGRIGEALEDLDRAIELQPDLLAAYFNRGAIRYSSEEFALALNDFDACIAIDPHSAGPYFNRASTRHMLDDQEGAKQDLGRFLELSDNPAWNKTATELLQQWDSS